MMIDAPRVLAPAYGQARRRHDITADAANIEAVRELSRAVANLHAIRRAKIDMLAAAAGNRPPCRRQSADALFELAQGLVAPMARIDIENDKSAPRRQPDVSVWRSFPKPADA